MRDADQQVDPLNVAALYTLGALILGVVATSAAGLWLMRVVASRLGRMTTRMIISPAIILHELSHALFMPFFGIHINEISVAGAFDSRRDAFVAYSYSLTNPLHYLGRLVSAWGPVIVPISLGVLWLHYPITPDGPLETAAMLYTLAVAAGAMALSEADWRDACEGVVVMVPVVLILGEWNPLGLFTAPPHRLWDSPATQLLAYLFGGALAIQLCLGSLLTLIGTIYRIIFGRQ